ncbi:MAG: helix-turn-helix transcriptional regulator [Gammaproteobacteria bacterium]|nr:helix-turn-helix transcriptional regulator [Gammaproteobacteria bacterium]
MEAHAADASRMLRSIANPHRLMLLCFLMNGEQSVSALNQHIPLSQSALSQHLAVLREEGLVTTRRENQTIFYMLSHHPILKILDTLHSVYCAPSLKSSTDQH